LEPVGVITLLSAPHLGRLLSLSANNRLGWKGLPGTNTLMCFSWAYHTRYFIQVGSGLTFKHWSRLERQTGISTLPYLSHSLVTKKEVYNISPTACDIFFTAMIVALL